MPYVQVTFRAFEPECRRCKGTGEIEKIWASGIMIGCPRCKGTGVNQDGYTYWVEEGPVNIGDRVMTPPNEVRETPSEAWVIAIGRNPGYDGPVKGARLADR